jgi:hypothetical protein
MLTVSTNFNFADFSSDSLPLIPLLKGPASQARLQTVLAPDLPPPLKSEQKINHKPWSSARESQDLTPHWAVAALPGHPTSFTPTIRSSMNSAMQVEGERDVTAGQRPVLSRISIEGNLFESAGDVLRTMQSFGNQFRDTLGRW